MTEIKVLNKDILPELYQKHFVNDFAHAEVLRPYQRLVELIETGQYEGLGLYCDGQLSAYIFVAKIDDILFIDFFAVLNGLRGGGLGSEMLKRLKSVYPKHSIVLEVEDVAFSEDDKDRITRENRVRFYQKNGFNIENIEISLFGDRYKIMVAGQGAGREDRIDMLRKLYDQLYTKSTARRNIKIL